MNLNEYMTLHEYAEMKQDEFSLILVKYNLSEYYFHRFSIILDASKKDEFKYMIHDNDTTKIYEYNSEEELVKAIKTDVRKEKIRKLLS